MEHSEGFCRNMVVSLDGSSASEQILPYVTTIATRTGASVTLVHVVNDSALRELRAWRNLPAVRELVEQDMERARTYLGTIRGRLESDGIPASVEVLLGAPAATIVDFAQQAGADIVALSTRGRGGLLRQVLGSVAAGVLQTATTPVLLYHPQETAMPTGAVAHLLVPLDGSALAEKALPIATQAAASLKVSVTLFRAIAGYTFSFPMSPDRSVETSAELLQAIANDATAYLSSQTTALQTKGVQVDFKQAFGDPATELLRAADEAPGSLIVMTTRGRGGLARALLGSVADKVVRSAGRPVLLVPAQA